MSEKKYAVWLSKISGLGSRSRIALCRAAQDLQADDDPARGLYRMPERDLYLCCRMAVKSQKRADKAAESILQARRLSRPDEEEQELAGKGISFLSIDDRQYPERLKNIPDPPYSLYFRGSLPSDKKPSLAVIGARMATPYGKKEAYGFGKKLASRGIQIVSGMAMGIDAIAGQAALDAEGDSFAVLGNGVDICYPAQNRDLYDLLADRGGLISEYPPGTAPQARLFPMRNRIISGLSDAVLVVEARKKSGTLITVDMALEQGREIFALPGRACDALSYGCNRLIAQGASIATCPEDLLQYFFGPDAFFAGDEVKRRGDGLSPVEAALFSALDESDAIDADRLAQMAETALGRRCSIKEINLALMQLVIKGLAAEVGIGHYRKT